MTDFKRTTHRIGGIDTVVLEAGSGPTLVYLHGAGTVTGFDFAAAWAERFHVVIPYHPGFGLSADDPEVTEIHDFVLHYLNLFERLGLHDVRLVGQSMGGFIATKFAIEHGRYIKKLALACPIGVPVPDDLATVNFLAVPPEELPALLAVNPQTVIRHLPVGEPSPAFIAERVKESATAARVLAGGAFDRKLPRYLDRLAMPMLIVWGKQDRLTPTGQHRSWAKLLPRARVELFEGAGHLLFDESQAAVEAVREFCA